MADRTIGDLPAASQLLTADLIPIEQGGNAKSISGQILANYAREKAQQAAGGYAANAAQSAADAAASAAEAAAWSEHPPYIGSNGNWWVYNTTTKRFVDSGVDASITVDIEDITMLATDASPYVTNTGTNTDPIFHLFIPRGATGLTGDTGNGISSAVLNADYTLTITFTDGTSYTTPSIRGVKGDTGNGITSIAKTGTSGLTDTYTITFDDSTTTTFTVTNGAKGDTGNGISGIALTTTAGLVDTYTISYTDGTSDTFTVTNGANGVSPSVEVSSITGGHSVEITDAEHPTGQTFNVMDGDDGVSPSVTVTAITGGHRVSVTDASGTQTFDVLDGLGSGDMVSTTYDPNGAVATAGGIPAYVESQLPSVPSAATETPSMDGTAAVGSGTKWAREDHVHPTDTSRQPVTLSSAITVGGVSKTTVEDALAAINTLADSKQDQVVFRTVTLTAANWVNNQQTVTVTGISATETDQLIQPVPATASLGEYTSCGILATGQEANSLTFTCSDVPTNNLTVYVVLTELEAAT